MLLFFALIASACATSTYVVGESTGAAVVGESAGAPSSTESAASTGSAQSASQVDVDPAPAVATVAPAPTPTREPEWTPEPLWTETDAGSSTPTLGQGGEATDESDSSPISAAGSAPVVELSDGFAVGDCYRTTDYQDEEPVACSEPHRAEVLLVGRLWHDADAAYPGQDTVNDLINDACVPAADAVGLVNGSGISTSTYSPGPNWWAQGDRSYVCFLQFGRSVTSSVASIAADQQAERAEEQVARQASIDQEFADKQLHVGDCATADGLTKIPCGQAHSYEVYARTNLSSAGGVYPGLGLIAEQSEEFCRREHEDAGLGGHIFAKYPSQWEWEDYGIHAVVCMASV